MQLNKFTISDLEQQISEMKRDFPELDADDDLRFDMLEGSTKFHEIIAALLDQAMESEMMSKAVKLMIDRLSARQSALDIRYDSRRSLIHRLMQLVEMRSIEVPAGKITVASTPKKVIITDESLIPEEYIRVKREPNKTLIKSALDRKEFVSGAALSNGGTTIQIR